MITARTAVSLILALSITVRLQAIPIVGTGSGDSYLSLLQERDSLTNQLKDLHLSVVRGARSITTAKEAQRYIQEFSALLKKMLALTTKIKQYIDSDSKQPTSFKQIFWHQPGINLVNLDTDIAEIKVFIQQIGQTTPEQIIDQIAQQRADFPRQEAEMIMQALEAQPGGQEAISNFYTLEDDIRNINYNYQQYDRWNRELKTEYDQYQATDLLQIIQKLIDSLNGAVKMFQALARTFPQFERLAALRAESFRICTSFDTATEDQPCTHWITIADTAGIQQLVQLLTAQQESLQKGATINESIQQINNLNLDNFGFKNVFYYDVDSAKETQQKLVETITLLKKLKTSVAVLPANSILAKLYVFDEQGVRSEQATTTGVITQMLAHLETAQVQLAERLKQTLLQAYNWSIEDANRDTLVYTRNPTPSYKDEVIRALEKSLADAQSYWTEYGQPEGDLPLLRYAVEATGKESEERAVPATPENIQTAIAYFKALS